MYKTTLNATEQLVAQKLFYLEEKRANDYCVLNDVLLEEGQKSSQMDHIVISYGGIFVIETKGYDGVVMGNDSDKEWEVTSPSGHISRFYSPIKQNLKHADALACTLSNEGVKRDDIFPMVVFKDEVELCVENIPCLRYCAVIKQSSLLEIIEGLTEPRILDPHRIEEFLIKRNLASNPEAVERHRKRAKAKQEEGFLNDIFTRDVMVFLYGEGSR